MRRTALKRRKNRKQKLADECDALWGRLVKWDWNYRCGWCGREGTDAHHVIGCGHHATRYEPLNGICLCRECHSWVHDAPAGKAVLEAWLVVRLPGVARWVAQHKNDTVKVTEAWLEAQRERLRGMERSE